VHPHFDAKTDTVFGDVVGYGDMLLA